MCRWTLALLAAGALGLALPALASAEPGTLTQLSGAKGCVEQDPTTVDDTCGSASSTLDSGDELSGARSVATYDGYVFAAGSDNADTSGIAVLKAESTGLTEVSCINSNGENGCLEDAELANGADAITDLAVSPQGNLYATIGSGEIVAMRFDASTGTLADVSGKGGCIATSGSNCNLTPDGVDPGDQLVFAPSGAYAYSDGNDTVLSYSVAGLGGLSVTGCVQCGVTGTGDVALPTSDSRQSANMIGLAITPNGARVYAVDANEDSVWMFDVVGSGDAKGTLALPDASTNPVDYCIQDSSAFDAGMCSASARGLTDLTGSIVTSADQAGQFVYAVSGGESDPGRIIEMQADLAGTPAGALSQLGPAPAGCISSDSSDDESSAQACATGTGLAEANDALMSPDGQNLYVTAGYESNGNLVGMAANTTTGALSEDPLSSGSEPDCYTDDGTGPGSGANPDCVQFQGLLGLDYNGDAAGGLAISAAGAGTVGGGSELYLAAATDDGVADLERNSPTQYTVTGESSDPGDGTVTATSSSAGASCSGDSCAVYADATVTLSANAASGDRFIGWEGAGHPCDGSTATTCTVTNVQADVTAEAEFAAPPTVSDYTMTPLSHTSEKITADLFGHDLTTSYEIEYGNSTAYGKTVAGGSYSGSSEDTVSFTLTNLIEGTLYSFDVVATSAAGTGDGGNGSFTTAGLPAPSPPNVTDVSAKLTSPAAAQVTAVVTAVPFTHQVLTGTVEYATDKAYRLRTAKRDSDPYTDRTAHGLILANQLLSNQSSSPQPIGNLTGLAPSTVYDYRAVVTAMIGGIQRTANGQFATPPPGPTATTGPASSVTANGATLSGTLDDKGTLASFKFDWTATYTPPGGCGPATITGEVGSVVLGVNGPQTVTEPLTQPLPVGSTVSYRLELITKYDGFHVDVLAGNSQKFPTGSVPDSGDVGFALVRGSSSAQIAAVIPGFTEQAIPGSAESIRQTGYASDGGIEFTGTGTPEWGLFQYTDASAPTPTYSPGATIGSACGTYVQTTLTGLQAGNVYGFTPVQAYGIGVCPGPSSPPANYSGGPIYADVDQIGTWDSCWTDPSNIEESYLNGGFGNDSSDYPYPPVDPTWIGPFLAGAYALGQPWGDPVLGANAYFTTAATSPPSDTTVIQGTSGETGVSDGLGCETPSKCSGDQTAEAVSTPPGEAVDARAGARLVVLGSTKFSIAPHDRKRITVRLTKAGQRFLQAHPRILSLQLVTTETLHDGRKVTLTATVILPRRKRSKHR